MKSRNGTGEEDEDEDGWEYYYDEEEEEDNPESGSVSISTPVPPVLPAVQKQPEQPSTKPVQAAATNRQDDHGKQHPLSRPNSRQTRSRPGSRSGTNHSKNELVSFIIYLVSNHQTYQVSTQNGRFQSAKFK